MVWVQTSQTGATYSSVQTQQRERPPPQQLQQQQQKRQAQHHNNCSIKKRRTSKNQQDHNTIIKPTVRKQVNMFDEARRQSPLFWFYASERANRRDHTADSHDLRCVAVPVWRGSTPQWPQLGMFWHLPLSFFVLWWFYAMISHRPIGFSWVPSSQQRSSWAKAQCRCRRMPCLRLSVTALAVMACREGMAWEERRGWTWQALHWHLQEEKPPHAWKAAADGWHEICWN